MIGYLYALVAAVFFAARGGLNKKLVIDFNGACSSLSVPNQTDDKKQQRKHEGRIIVWSIALIQLLIYGIGLIIVGVPKVDLEYWYWLLIWNFPVFILKMFWMIRALQSIKLSHLGPLLSVAPLFAAVFSWLLLHELPNTWGMYGIVLVVIGIYLMDLRQLQVSAFEPLRKIFTVAGNRYAIGAAALMGLGGNLDKIVLRLCDGSNVSMDRSNAFFYLFTINALVVIFLSLAYARKHPKIYLRGLRKGAVPLTLLAVVGAGGVIFQALAIQQILVPYVASIKRVGELLGSVIIGTLFFRENNLKNCIIGGLIIAIGIVFIVVLGRV